jgi:hypothetical protein
VQIDIGSKKGRHKGLPFFLALVYVVFKEASVYSLVFFLLQKCKACVKLLYGCLNFRSKPMTRCFTIIGAVCALLLAVSGCENRAGTASRRVELTESGFPKTMVGFWEAKSEEYDWGIRFNSDGSIPKIIHPAAGPVVLAEGGVSGEGPVEGTYYIVLMGPCEARYEPETGMVKVKITIDYSRMQFVDGALEDREKNYIEGPVSQDGKTWQAKWRSYCWLEGASPPDINMIEANPETLVFTKLEFD